MNNLERIDKLISRVENLVEDIEKLMTMQKEIDKKIFKLERKLDENDK